MTGRPGVAVTARLAEFATAAVPGTVPDEVRSVTRRTVVNSVVLAACAGQHRSVQIARATARALGVPQEASVLGTSERTGLLWAPLINGIAMHVEDFDDTHLATVIHPGAPVVSAALAAAERVGSTGREFCDAVLIGVEVALRVGIGICPSHFDIGWHITGTAGHLGATAAAGRLLGLDPQRMTVALALACVEAAGITEANGSMAKALHPGKAAADGVEAALLAGEGISGPVDAIESGRGLAALTSDSSRLETMVEDLGHHWHAGDNTFKPYACGIVSHAVIDAGIRLRSTGAVPADRIVEVEVRVNPVVLDVMGIAEPRTGLESKFSVYHCFAVGLLRGVAGPAEFSDAAAAAPDIAALRSRVRVTVDPTVRKDEADVSVRLAGGERMHEHVLHATGSLDSPMSDAQLRAKCRVVGSSTGLAVDDLVDLTFDVASLDSLAPIFAAAALGA